MQAYLYKIANIFHQKHGNELYKLTFVFPNRRAGVFFQKYLAEIAEGAIFSPNIITIQELFETLSGLKIADKVDLLVLFYEQFVKVSNSKETLDEFLFWGEMLLNDFSDVDKYMIDAKQLFQNIHDLKSMEDDMSYLSEEQIKAIRQFWENFSPNENNDTKSKFMETWQILLELYNSFRELLSTKGLSYEGMQFREVAELAKKREELDLPYEQIVFVGLNAITPTETVLLEYLKDKGIADFYWDYDSKLIRDKKNRASFWFEENIRRFPSKISYNNENSPTTEEKKKATLIGVPSGVGQAKIVNQLLADLIKNDKLSNTTSGLNTAIVLPDENLLLPVLYSIPQDIEKINVTMGYSLQHSSVASLISSIASMLNNAKESKGETVIYYKYVLAILNHPLIANSIGKSVDELVAYIQKYNRVMLSTNELGNEELTKFIFTPIKEWKDVSNYLKHLLSEIYKHLSAKKHDDSDTTGDVRALDIELEFIVQYYKTINRLQDSLTSVKEMSVDTYFRLLKQLSQSISISFIGEPLSGLQVMGILETRVIDFENIIILSMNEGTFPLKKPSNSFVPYTLRKAFGMPTYEHQDSTYAYHFYRMISRAKNIYMLYDTRTEDMQSGEVSRYFYQMKYLYNDYFDINEVMINYNVSAPEIEPVSITKTPEIINKLQKFAFGGSASISASSINNYLNCPLQFYLSAVEGLSDEEEVQESIEASVFGTIYHAVMQHLYDRYKNKTILPDTINSIIDNEKYIIQLIEEAFAEHYFKQKDKKVKLTGHHFLISQIILDYIKQTFQFDRSIAPFEYIDSEYKFKLKHDVSDKLSVNIKGSIDRIDICEGKVRLIDYKTGRGDLGFSDFDDMFDTSKSNRKSHILQVFFYALAYKNTSLPVVPAIYYLRDVFNENYDPRLIYNKEPMNNVEGMMDEFTARLNNLIEEIFNPDIPFSQTENEAICKWCAFKDICRR